MWNVNAKKMCRNHLLGEHVETHMFAGCIKKKKSLKGYVDTGLVEVHNLKKRHDVLAKEMKIRGMNHKSPIQFFKAYKAGKVDIKKSKKDLINRCLECKVNFNK